MLDTAIGIYYIGILAAALFILRRSRRLSGPTIASYEANIHNLGRDGTGDRDRWSQRDSNYQRICDRLERRAWRFGWADKTVH